LSESINSDGADGNRSRLPNRRSSTSFNIATNSTANARQWWAAESQRIGTDWIGIAETVCNIMHQLAVTSSSWRSS
jgi:hypothetical protein